MISSPLPFQNVTLLFFWYALGFIIFISRVPERLYPKRWASDCRYTRYLPRCIVIICRLFSGQLLTDLKSWLMLETSQSVGHDGLRQPHTVALLRPCGDLRVVLPHCRQSSVAERFWMHAIRIGCTRVLYKWATWPRLTPPSTNAIHTSLIFPSFTTCRYIKVLCITLLLTPPIMVIIAGVASAMLLLGPQLS
jgi:hypothetical protein